MRVVVVGAGAAGTAAVWHAARAGAEVEVIHAKSGATELYSGALDLGEWEQPCARSIDPGVAQFAEALGVWALPDRVCQVATDCGVLRPAQGADRWVLDLAPLGGRTIAVADVPQDGWDAPWLARALGNSSWARSTGTRFCAVPLRLLESESERRLNAHELAHQHDRPERLERLAAQLANPASGVDAWLLGPWLGLQPTTLSQLQAAAARPIGEVLSPPGGPAGARFALARDSLMAAARVRARRGRVVAVRAVAGNWRVEFASLQGESAPPGTEILDADAVVLAVGGLVSGGVRLDRALHEGGARTCFKLSLEAPVRFRLDRAELDQVSSLNGIDWQTQGWEAIERVGVSADGPRVSGAKGLYVAGAAAAGIERTALESARSGIAAAAAACESQ